jgi:hypothetical protein
VWPGSFETKTADNGAYQLDVLGGAVWKIIVRKEGFIPAVISDGDKSSPQLPRVREGASVSYNIEMGEAASKPQGTVVLNESKTDLLAGFGLIVSPIGQGDCTLSKFIIMEKVGPPTITTIHAQFCACFPGQRGILEVQNIGDTPLDQIPIPPIGYRTDARYEAGVGKVYVAKAREGMEGHVVIFRVDKMALDGVTISYLFK